jgi:hypothetical protein
MGDVFKAVIFFIVLPLVVLVVVLVGVQAYWLATRTTEGDVRNLVENNLDEDATSDEIVDFLNSRGIDNSGVTTEDSSTVLDAGYPKQTSYIVAIMQDTSRWFTGTSGIQIYFILDGDLRMRDYIIEEFITTF